MCLSGKCVTLWCRKTMTIMTGGEIWLLATTVKNAKTARSEERRVGKEC